MRHIVQSEPDGRFLLRPEFLRGIAASVVLFTTGLGTPTAKGIGAAISRVAAAEGAIPVIVDRDVEAANTLHSELPGSELVIAELSSPESCYICRR